MQKNDKPLFTLTVQEFLDLNQRQIRRLLGKAESSKPQENEDEILDVGEAANFLKVSKSTLYQMTSQRRISHLKRAKRLYFRKRDLVEYLESGKIEVV